MIGRDARRAQEATLWRLEATLWRLEATLWRLEATLLSARWCK